MISETALLYFFSALFQGLAAILGLLGIFGVFRLQQIGSTLDGARNELYSDKGHSTVPATIESFESLSLDQKRAWVESRKGLGSLPLFRIWISCESEAAILRGKLWPPVALLAIAAMLNAWLLPFSGWISRCEGGWVIAVVFFDLALATIGVAWNLKGIRDLVEAPEGRADQKSGSKSGSTVESGGKAVPVVE